MKKYAVVKFLSTKDDGYSQGYTYENPVKAKVYDAVIVPTRYGLSLAVVTELSDEVPDTFTYGCGTIKAISEVVKSDTVAKATTLEKKKDLKKKLNAKVKKMDELKLFEAYAGDDSEFAELLKEYKSL